MARRTFQHTMRARSLWSLLFVGAAVPLAAQDPLFHRLTVGNGLPSNNVYTILQEPGGFIWFGTDAGAVRYDGIHLDLYNTANGLSDNEVFVLTADRRGRTWFLTGNGRPCYLDSNGLHSGRTDSSLARIDMRSGIRSLYEDGEGTLWFGGLKGDVTALTKGGEVRSISSANPFSGRVGGHVTVTGTSNGAVRLFNNSVPTGMGVTKKIQTKAQLEQPVIVQSFPDGVLLATTQRRVLEWRDSSWVTLLDTADVPGTGAFHHAYRTADKELWVALRDGGILWLKKEQGTWRPVRDVLFRSDLINNFLQDREGNIWLCTAYGGVIMFTEQAARTAYYRGLRGGREELLLIHAANSTGMIWCGTNQGDLYRLGETLELVDLPPAGELFSKISGLRSVGTTLWAATDQHLFRVEPDGPGWTVTDVPSKGRSTLNQASVSGMKALTIGADGRVISSMYGLFELEPGGRYMVRMGDPAIPDVRIYAPHLDPKGTLWFEEQGRLFSTTDGTARPHAEVVLTDGVRITGMASLGDTLVLATSGDGLLLWHGGRIVRRITEADGLSSSNVLHLTADRGELFAASNRGADRVSGPWSAPRVLRYATTTGTQPLNIRDLAADSAYAYVLFADGLCRMPRIADNKDLPVPIPYVRSILVNDSVAQGRTIVGVRQNVDRLVVEVGAVHFTTPDLVLMEYRLNPANGWQRIAGLGPDLNRLAAGNHVLQIRAALEQGPWSAPAELRVVVVPRFVDRWWARTIIILTVIALTFVILRTIAYGRYRRQEERVRQREVLVQERHRIAMDLHDDLGAELSSLLLLTRMERDRPGQGGLERLEEMAATLTEKIKEVIWSTDPGHDTLEATLSFIQRRLANLCAQHGLMSRTTIDPTMPPVELPAGIRRELFLIAKEAGNNALKHANARTFTFGATLDADVVVLTFTDDGVGGAADGMHDDGRGLRNMKQRAVALGASLLFSEVSPHGTRITLRLPVPGHRPNG
jgi:signal transduction histidine kinase/ligand-binding sensor domain-containing protein